MDPVLRTVSVACSSALSAGRVHGSTDPAPWADVDRASGLLASSTMLMLAQLDSWVARHGTADVPQIARTTLADGGSYWLGRRVSEARMAHRRGTLNQVVVAELERRTGWVWQAKLARWQQDMDWLTTHLEATGSMVGAPARLQDWLRRQQHRLDLSSDQRTQLEAFKGIAHHRDGPR